MLYMYILYYCILDYVNPFSIYMHSTFWREECVMWLRARHIWYSDPYSSILCLHVVGICYMAPLYKYLYLRLVHGFWSHGIINRNDTEINYTHLSFVRSFVSRA